MKKKLLSLVMATVIALGTVVAGLAVNTTEVYASAQISAAESAKKSAPSIELNKTYKVAARNVDASSKADILAWASNRWNGCEYVKFKMDQAGTIKLTAKQTGAESSWITLFNSKGEAISRQFCIGTRADVKSISEKFKLSRGTYYVGLEPHSTMTLNVTAYATMSNTKLNLRKGDSVKLSVKYLKTAEPITWVSGKKSVATVDKRGKVVAKKPGTAVIFAIVDNQCYQCTVKVSK